MITPERAAEIVRVAKAKTQYGPWVDKLDSSMTKDEIEIVKKHWETLDGDTCFMNAFFDFLHGNVPM